MCELQLAKARLPKMQATCNVVKFWTHTNTLLEALGFTISLTL